MRLPRLSRVVFDPRVLPLARRAYLAYVRRALGRVDRADARRLAGRDPREVPPAYLRFRATGVPQLEHFARSGRQARRRLDAALARAGRPLAPGARVLDFGCGCGRVLRWFEDAATGCEFFGVDIDRDAVAWCARHLGFARLSASRPDPPLEFSPETFDLVYSLSVFVHLGEREQLCWLAELRRVVRPGGLVVLTTLSLADSPGPLSPVELASAAAELERQGFVLVRGVFLRRGRGYRLTPSWAQNAYHTEAYVRRRFAEYFDVVEFAFDPCLGRNLVVLRKPCDAPDAVT